MSLTIEITALAYGGNGIGRIDNKVVFVPFTAPGDVAEIEITEDKKDFSIAKLVSLKEPSKIRTSPPCPVYTICGGCQIQHIEYANQVSLKEKSFIETFQRLAKIDLTPILSPALASPEPFNYRSRVRFHKAGGKWGFFKPNSHSIVEMQDCPLLEPPLNSTLQALKAPDFPDTLHSAEVSLDKESGKAVAAFYVSKNTSFDFAGAINKIPLIKGFEVWVKDPFKRGKGRMVITEGDTRISYKVGGFTISSGVTSFS
ncbi:MAG: TRAM domain-containing protein, partial [Deltaproteobacteria bacterium]